MEIITEFKEPIMGILVCVILVLLSLESYISKKGNKTELDNNQFVDIKSKLEEINNRLDNVEKNIKEK